jgi:hypothetical protein
MASIRLEISHKTVLVGICLLALLWNSTCQAEEASTVQAPATKAPVEQADYAFR